MTELTQTILKTLKAHTWTVAFGESLTAGYGVSALASQDGISEVLRGGVVCYDIPTKVRLLKVDQNFAEACNAVSERTAQEMAQGCTEMFDSDVGVSTTGYATLWKNFPLEAFVAVYHRETQQLFSTRVDLSRLNDRESRRRFCAEEALTMLLRSLSPQL